MNKITNYINYIFSDYPESEKIKEIKTEIEINLNERVDDYISEGMDESDAITKAIDSLGDIDELLESFEVKTTNQFYSEKVSRYLNEINESFGVFQKNKPKNALKISVGVLLILHGLSIVGTFSDDDYFSELAGSLSIFYFFLMIVVAVSLFIFAGFNINKHQYTPEFSEKDLKEFDNDESIIKTRNNLRKQSNEQSEKYNPTLVLGIALCIISVAFGALLSFLNLEIIIPLVFFTFIAVGASLIVYSAMNKTIFPYLYSYEETIAEKKVDSYGGIIMMGATIIFLGIGFIFNIWHPTWAIFPLAGISVGIIDTLLKRNVH